MHVAYIGMGSNLASRAGSSRETVAAAFAALRDVGEVVARSSLYKTAPVGFADQPAFINAVAAVRTGDDPVEALKKLLEIERTFGRDRKTALPKGPRTLDLDLLLMDDLIVRTPLLTLPHPALAERRFVLAPLAEIAPELVHPELRLTMKELLRRLPDKDENRIEDVRVLKGSSVE